MTRLLQVDTNAVVGKEKQDKDKDKGSTMVHAMYVVAMVGKRHVSGQSDTEQ